MKEERDAGLLDTPWRGKVLEIPRLPELPPDPATMTDGGGQPTRADAPIPLPGLAPPALPTTTTPFTSTPQGPGPGVGAGAGAGAAAGAGAGAAAVGLRLLSAVASGLVVFFWSNHAPAWRDETSPLTDWAWDNGDEQKWWHRTLTQEQRDYLVMLAGARKGRDVDVTDKDPTLMPAGVLEAAAAQRPKPEQQDKCVSLPVPRRGGNARHDAYALKVTGSPLDYFVMAPSKVFMNYDGLSSPRLVWEVKTGHGWMFNPGSQDLALRVVAAWDAQKNRGLEVAGSCNYVHIWSVTDKWIRDSLLIRWGGNPFVANISE